MYTTRNSATLTDQRDSYAVSCRLQRTAVSTPKPRPLLLTQVVRRGYLLPVLGAILILYTSPTATFRTDMDVFVILSNGSAIILYWRGMQARSLSNFVMNLTFPKTRVSGLSVGEGMAILAFVVLTQYQRVTDGQTDRHLWYSNTSA